MLMGQREYARHRGCALRAVQKAIEAKRISVVDVDGKQKIDSEQADRDWLANTDPAKQSLLNSSGPASVRRSSSDVHRGANGNGGDRRAPADENGAGDDQGSADGDGRSPDDLVDDEDDPHTTAYRKSRAEREAIRVERDQIELDVLRGKYIEVAEANRMVFTAFRALRDSVLNVPARVKDEIAAESDAFRCEQLMDAELVAALETFNPVRALRDADDDEAG